MYILLNLWYCPENFLSLNDLVRFWYYVCVCLKSCVERVPSFLFSESFCKICFISTLKGWLSLSLKPSIQVWNFWGKILVLNKVSLANTRLFRLLSCYLNRKECWITFNFYMMIVKDWWRVCFWQKQHHRYQSWKTVYIIENIFREKYCNRK